MGKQTDEDSEALAGLAIAIRDAAEKDMGVPEECFASAADYMPEAKAARAWFAARPPQPAPTVSAEQVREAVGDVEWDEQHPDAPASAFLAALGIEVKP